MNINIPVLTKFIRRLRCMIQHQLVITQRLPYKAVRSQCLRCDRIFVTEQLDSGAVPTRVTTQWDEQDAENYVVLGAVLRYTDGERRQMALERAAANALERYRNL